MPQEENEKNIVKLDDEKKEDSTSKIKMEKILSILLYGLVGEIVFCLLCGWIYGLITKTYKTLETKESIVTGLLQNYNFVLGVVLLIPLIIFLFKKIKPIIVKKINEDDRALKIFIIIIAIAIIGLVEINTNVYYINSKHKCGENAAGTATLFVCCTFIVLLEIVVYGIFNIIEMKKEKGKLWKSILKYSPIIFLVMFMIWTSISCLLAPGAADDVLGKSIANSTGNSPREVLSKTLNGCINLKDGYWAFLMYGSVLITTMLLGKDRIKEKKNLIVVFVLVITAVSIATLFMANVEKEYKAHPENYYISGEKTNKIELREIFDKWYIYPQKGIFHNSNHFGYVLCMAVIAAAGLALTGKKIISQLLYLLMFAITTWMLIVNDTFGAYLGVVIALFSMTIYVVASLFLKKDNKWKSLIVMCIIIGIFTIFSSNIAKDGRIIAKRNIEEFAKDIKIFGGYMLTENNKTENNSTKNVITDNSTSGDMLSGEILSGDIVSENTSKKLELIELDIAVADAGSGRGDTWIRIWDLVKQRPLFGYGLECLLFQFSYQFKIDEGRTHNLLLQLLGTVGIPGTIFYFTALAIVFIRLVKNWKTWNDVETICTFVGISYMITAMTGNSSYYTSPYFMMFLGFVVLTPWKRAETQNK